MGTTIKQQSAEPTHVYRLNDANKGRLCAVTEPAKLRKVGGKVEINDGNCLVGITFEDGEKAIVSRQALYLRNSRAGWQVLAKVRKERKAAA